MSDSDTIRSAFLSELNKITSLSDLENVKIRYLGRKGEINTFLSKLKNIQPNERKKVGLKVNELKKEIKKRLEERKVSLLLRQEKELKIDVTLPGFKYPRGGLHPVTIAIEEVAKIFEKIGFIHLSYPEVEWEYYAFESLNMPDGHPARDDFETFFIDSKPHPKLGQMLLTPHTSSGQNREMKRLKKPPIRMINIARCYRPNWDVTHVPMFYQFEGLCVDERINLTHLKGTLDYFVKEFFGAKREARVRPFHFQFTEPSFEVDVSCGACFGKGTVSGEKCRVCKSGWLELGGAGMVHPFVLKEGDIDPKKYSGFAFGWGVERVFMMKEDFKLDDLRTMYSGDVRFLEQF
ncbi:phenylalanine--tRNA ligase subunit alpha [Candidatus Roizmanbacteria bacterium]|nr:phenylalanine--tRNA ligase subunit alpha [Candidatus Roizmanbacteria bacterium]